MRKWSQIAADPNAKAAKTWRLSVLNAARREPVKNRIAYLEEIVRGKRVLDVGAVAHTAVMAGTAEWLHRAISQSAAYCLGVDVLEEEVKKLQAMGYNVRCADITQEDLAGEERFDVMIVGEVIEHLGEPGQLFEAGERLLVSGGRMVLTTPNPYYWKRMRNALCRWYRRVESVDHVTMLFPSGMAELAERAGMELESYRGVYRHSTMVGLKKLLAATVVQAEVFCETMIYEFWRNGPGP